MSNFNLVLQEIDAQVDELNKRFNDTSNDVRYVVSRILGMFIMFVSFNFNWRLCMFWCEL